MVTYVDVGLAFDNMFAPNHIVANKRKHAKHPAPRFHKKERNGNGMRPKEGRQNNPRQKQQHKNCKHQKDPENIDCRKYRVDQLHRLQNWSNKKFPKGREMSFKCER